MIETIKRFVLFFVIITTGILLVFGINTIRYETIQTSHIWKIFIVSGITSLVTTIVFSIDPKKPMKRFVYVLIAIGHILLLVAIVFFAGTKFEWFKFSWGGFLGVFGSVAIVYAFTAVISIILANKETRTLNDALSKYADKKN